MEYRHRSPPQHLCRVARNKDLPELVDASPFVGFQAEQIDHVASQLIDDCPFQSFQSNHKHNWMSERDSLTLSSPGEERDCFFDRQIGNEPVELWTEADLHVSFLGGGEVEKWRGGDKERERRTDLLMSLPLMMISPVVGRRSLMSMRKVVVLPAPLAPARRSKSMHKRMRRRDLTEKTKAGLFGDVEVEVVDSGEDAIAACFGFGLFESLDEITNDDDCGGCR